MAWLLADGGVGAGPDLCLGTVDAWILWNLTAGALHATDPSNASRTLLYDLEAGGWSAELGELFGVPIAALPEIRPSSGRLGTTAAGAIPISGVAGDQQAALFGQACVEPGMAKATLGTGAFVLVHAGSQPPPPPAGLLSTVAWDLPGSGRAFALEGSVFSAGATLGWLAGGLGLVASPAEAAALAATVANAGGAYLVPAFAGLGSPFWDPDARGTLVGITKGTGRAEVARAAVEAIAYQTRDVIEAMAAAGVPVTHLRADGGAAASDLVLQLHADQLGLPVARPAQTETTAIGAAWLAGLGEGVWGSLDELAGLWALDADFAPKASPGAAGTRYRGWQRAVER
ncbi:MAG: FGGY family carbohydrate kinase, partial [Acidimicrobiales bacterium]